MDEKGQIAFDLTAVMVVFLLVSLRLWTMFYVRRYDYSTRPPAHILSDAFVVGAWIFGTTILGLDVWVMLEKIEAKARGELLMPGLDVPFNVAEKYLQIGYINVLSLTTVLWCTKASLLCTYFTVTKRGSRRVEILVWVCITITAAAYVVSILSYLFWCWPISRYWSLDLNGDSCMVYTMFSISTFNTALHLATDLFVMFLGFVIISTLQLGKREYWALVFIFTLGACTIATAVVRYLVQLHLIAETEKLNLVDNAKHIQTIYIAGVAEGSGAILAICLPSFRVFLRAKSGSQDFSLPVSTKESKREYLRNDQIYVDMYVSVTSETDGMSVRTLETGKGSIASLDMYRSELPW